MKSSVGFYSAIRSIILWITAAIRHVSEIILVQLLTKCGKSGNVPWTALHDSAAGPGQHTPHQETSSTPGRLQGLVKLYNTLCQSNSG